MAISNRYRAVYKSIRRNEFLGHHPKHTFHSFAKAKRRHNNVGYLLQATAIKSELLRSLFGY